MEISFSYYPQVFLLVMARVSAMTGGVIFFGRDRITPRIRIGIAFAVTLVFLPVIPAPWAKAAMAMTTLPDILFGMANEVLLGFAIALICDAFLAICHLGGFIISFGSSLSMAQSIDPVNGTTHDILGSILQLVFLLIFIVNDGHLALLRMLFHSFSVIPPSMSWLTTDLLSHLIALGSLMFEWAVKLAAPAIAISLILDACLGLVARMAPDFDILFLSLPVRIFVGLGAFGLTLRYGGPFFGRMCEMVLTCCSRVLEG